MRNPGFLFLQGTIELIYNTMLDFFHNQLTALSPKFVCFYQYLDTGDIDDDDCEYCDDDDYYDPVAEYEERLAESEWEEEEFGDCLKEWW